MKKIIVLTGIVVAGVTFSNAQEIRATETKQVQKKEVQSAKVEKQNRKLSEMDEVVGLSDEQRNKIEVINKEQNAKMKEIRVKYADKQGDEKKIMRDEIQVVQKERKAKVQAVLTDEQKVKWKAHQEQKREAKKAAKPVEQK